MTDWALLILIQKSPSPSQMERSWGEGGGPWFRECRVPCTTARNMQHIVCVVAGGPLRGNISDHVLSIFVSYIYLNFNLKAHICTLVLPTSTCNFYTCKHGFVISMHLLSTMKSVKRQLRRKLDTDR